MRFKINGEYVFLKSRLPQDLHNKKSQMMLKNKAGVPKLWNKHMSGCCDDIVLSIVVSEVKSDLRS